MSDVDERVNTIFQVTDNATRGVKNIGGVFESTGGLISRATSLLNPLNAALAALGTGLSLAGVAALGDKFEQTQNQMAGFLSALGFASNYNDGLLMAAETMEKIRVDAAALPGEAEDYMMVFKAALPAVEKAVGGTMENMTAFTNRYTAITKTLGVDASQAARDLDLMLRRGTGGAGMDVRSFTSMLPFMRKVEGSAELTRESFNKMNEQARAKLLEKTFVKLDPMLKQAATSWDAMLGAAKSNTRELIRQMSSPIFEGMKKGLEQVNALFFDSNGAATELTSSIVDMGKNFSTYVVESAKTFVSIIKDVKDNGLAGLTAHMPGGLGAAGPGGVGGVLGLLGGAKMALPAVGEILAGGGTAGAAGSALASAALPAAALAAVLLELSTRTEFLVTIWDQLGTTVSILSRVLDPLLTIFTSVGNAGADIVEQLLPSLLNVINWGLDPFMTVFTVVIDILSTAIDVLRPWWRGIASLLGGLLEAVGALIYMFAKPLSIIFEGLWGILKEHVVPLFLTVTTALGGFLEAIGDILSFWAQSRKEATDKLVTPQGAEDMIGDSMNQGYSPLMDLGTLTKAFVGAAKRAEMTKHNADQKRKEAAKGRTPTQDFRFSRFEINQKFAEGFDPDRIAIAFSKDVGKMGERKMQSNLEPSFTAGV